MAVAKAVLTAFAGGLLVAVIAVSDPALAQTLPCVYTAADGSVVITDSADDPNCPNAPAKRKGPTTVRTPGRLNVDMAVAEAISLAHAAAQRHRIDHRLVESLIEMESSFDHQAVSRAGAMGLMQLMPAVARRYGAEDPFDPAQNVDAGVRYLRRLLLRYAGSVELALAAYNAGPGAVDKYDGVPPYAETQQYVMRVIYRYRQRVDGRPLH
ncbi:MAG: transglycosylase SLT domain-containing protein [Acidobacteria bacterium]|nr:transglycosylase SLT domain-containing protein [Acidobacteriota bacterium]